ncbi:winged helix-turn-helix domain-containing protein [Cellulosimicrobium cellulans]|uniref:BTAD domain-containing putative transcriptional regulator n=1 Tax=Cellulosimicrobium cellulans TaxID=1710 RepID=UPI001965F4A1|nr:BTAD domain-containing putative transcriptional regulator [Cellulosimicrobium cellulans]MBN0040828.1 winged helix-turn-helix domain-containing protein [Cellulosimicrobium cellulans]
MVELRVEVLGPVRVLRDGAGVDPGGPRQRELLARLAAARGRPVSFERLAADLWDDDAERDPRDRRGALATFAGDLRRRLEPERAPRTPARVLVTGHGGYALRLPDDALDAARLEAAVVRATATAGDAPSGTARALADAVAAWRGEPYADLPDREWVRTERRHLADVHARAVELLAEALLADGRPGDAVAALDPHAAAHPWREHAWALLALALYREGRQTDALDVLRRARRRLADELGLDPGPELARLERDVLDQAPSLDGPTSGPRLAVTAPTSRTHLRSTVDVARTLAIAGGDHLATAQQQRVAAALAAEATGDPVLTARTVTAYDVPAVWTRSDDPGAADALVGVARRTLRRLGPDAAPVLRARLLAVVGVEHRGTRDAWAWAAAEDAVGIARDVGDPGTLALALNARFLQSFQRPGAGAERERTGAELVALAQAHDLPTFAILGHLVRMQAAAGAGRFGDADAHAAAAEGVAAEYESPVVPMLTAWYRAMRDAETAPADVAARAYRAADDLLAGVRMPGVRDGLLPLALLTVRVRHGRPLAGIEAADLGPYAPWAEPLLVLDAGDPGAAARLALASPEPPADHLRELLWALRAETALRLGDPTLAGRARRALARTPDEVAGAGSGLVSLGPVRDWLDRLDGHRRAP